MILNEERVTQVEGLLTMIPTFCKPTKAINKPIPTDIAIVIHFGRESKIIPLSPVTVKSKNIIPSINTKTRLLAYVNLKDKQQV